MIKNPKNGKKNLKKTDQVTINYLNIYKYSYNDVYY